MKTILLILTSLQKNDGVASFCINYYKNINHTEFKFIFLIHRNEIDDKYKELIERYNDIYIVFPQLKLSNVYNIKNLYLNTLKKYKIDIIHCNLPNMAFLYLNLGKNENINLRIIHSHATKLSDSYIRNIRNHILWAIGKRFATKKIACSMAAGKYLFGNENFDIIYNAINFDKFKFDFKKRCIFRKKLNISENEVLVLVVGRICKQKNQLFLLRFIEKISSRIKFVFIGSHADDKYYKKFVSKIGSNLYINQVSDIENYYNAGDLLLLPSQYEGLPLTLVEAQASGLRCIASDKVTREVDFGLCSFIPLKPEKRINEINSFLISVHRCSFENTNYNIKISVKKLENIYKGG